MLSGKSLCVTFMYDEIIHDSVEPNNLKEISSLPGNLRAVSQSEWHLPRARANWVS